MGIRIKAGGDAEVKAGRDVVASVSDGLSVEEVARIFVALTEEFRKGAEADPGKVESLLNSLPRDVLDVILAGVLQGPLAVVGLVAQKLGDKVSVSRKGR